MGASLGFPKNRFRYQQVFQGRLKYCLEMLELQLLARLGLGCKEQDLNQSCLESREF